MQMHLSEYICIMCPDVTTKKQKKVLDAPGIGVTGIGVGTKSGCSERTKNVLNL